VSLRTTEALRPLGTNTHWESQGDAEIPGEAIAYVAGEEDLRAIARECRLPVEVVRRQLSGRRTLTLRTMMGALRALGFQLRVELAG